MEGGRRLGHLPEARHAPDETAEVHRIPYDYDEQDFPLTGDAKNCYLQWIVDVQCYNNYRQYPGFANLFLYNALNKAAWRDDTAPGTEVYEAGFFNYATDQTPKEAGFLGFADDNWQTAGSSASSRRTARARSRRAMRTSTRPAQARTAARTRTAAAPRALRETGAPARGSSSFLGASCS